MATRKEEKERLRQERLAQEQEAQGRPRTRNLGAYAVAGVLSAAVIAGIVAMVAGGNGSSSTAEAAGAFGQHYGGLANRRAAANVPTMMDTMSSTVHIHPQLEVFVKGKKIEIPANIGIDPSQPSMSMAGLHTHDSTGTIHNEGMPGARLGQFFDVWGVPFSKRQLGPYKSAGTKSVRMWVDGKSSKAFWNLLLEDGQQIVVAYGTPAQTPKGLSG